MYIHKDTKTGEIVISGEYNLGEMIEYLSQLNPDFTWKELMTRDRIILKLPPLPPFNDGLPF